MVSAGMPVMPAAHSGVYSATRAAQSSKPTVQLATYSASYLFWEMSTFAMARMSARSVPGLMGTHSSA